MDSPILKIHSCEEIPNEADLSKDEDCLQLVEATYVALKWRGGGQHGIALETTTSYGTPARSQRMVIKIGRINAGELRIACELNALAGETPVFPHTFGWLICHEIPTPWRRAIGNRGKNHELLTNPPPLYLFTFVQAVEEGWDTFAFSLYDNSYRIALFYLLHALYVGRQRIGFRHGDIHSGNVMIQQELSMRRTPTATTLRYDQYEATVTSRFVPRLIDYGRSATARHAGQDDRPSNDLRMLRNMFDRHFDDEDYEDDENVRDEGNAFNRFIASSGWRAIEERYNEEGPHAMIPILTHEYFDIPEIQRQRVKRQTTEPIQRCFNCCVSEPTHQINHPVTPSKYFCGRWCHEATMAITAFIK